MAWIVLRHLLTWPCQPPTRWCVGVKFVTRGTLQTWSFEVQMLPIRNQECSTGSQQRYVQFFTLLEGRPAAFVWSHSEIKTPNTWNTKDNKKTRTFAVSRSAAEKQGKLRTSTQSSKEPVAGDIEMEQVAFPKFSSATLNFHVRGKLSDMINEASPNSLIQISLWDTFRIRTPSLVRVNQMMGNHFAGNKLMAWIVLRHLLTWPCQPPTRWCVRFNLVCRGTLQTRSFEVQMLPIRNQECSTGSQQRYVQFFTLLEGRPAAFVWSHSEIKTPNTWNTKDNKKTRTFAVSRSAAEKQGKLRTSTQSSKEPVAGDIEMEQVAFPKFSSGTLNFHMRGKLSDMINEASPNSLIQISPSGM